MAKQTYDPIIAEIFKRHHAIESMPRRSHPPTFSSMGLPKTELTLP